MNRYIMGIAVIAAIAVATALALLPDSPLFAGGSAALPASANGAAIQLSQAPEAPPPEAVAPEADPADPLADRVLGDPDAPVTIIEYSSLTCPHCAAFHRETLPVFKERYIDTGQVKLIYRDFPFDAVALRAAMLARCANPDRYFGVLDVLFKSQERWSRAEDPVKALAQIGRLAGVGEEEFQACMSNEALMDGVLNLRLEGERTYSISSTPTFIITSNGRTERVVGAQPIDAFAQVIDPMLPQEPQE